MASNQSTGLMFVLFLSCTIVTLTLARLSEDKMYIIRSSARPDFVVDGVDGAVQLKYYTGFRTQLWKFRGAPKDDGSYNIINVYDGTALDIERDSSSPLLGYVVLRAPQSDSSSSSSSSFQKWKVTSEGHIVNVGKKLNLDIANELYATGTRLQVWKSNGRPAQLFKVEPEPDREDSLWGAATLLIINT